VVLAIAAIVWAVWRSKHETAEMRAVEKELDQAKA